MVQIFSGLISHMGHIGHHILMGHMGQMFNGLTGHMGQISHQIVMNYVVI